MTRKFRTEPVTAREFHTETIEELYGRIGGMKADRWLRGLVLLTHWWAAGHDPRRSLLRCGACDGRTVMWSGNLTSWFSCPRCSGSGIDKVKRCEQ